MRLVFFKANAQAIQRRRESAILYKESQLPMNYLPMGHFRKYVLPEGGRKYQKKPKSAQKCTKGIGVHQRRVKLQKLP